jgi:SAM-dependent methyltransferase
MKTTPAACPADDWSAYVATDYSFSDFPAGARVLDIGFGRGDEMRAAERNGARAFGIDYDGNRVARGAAAGLRVCRGSADRLPFATACLDGVICKVVVMYTDESRSIAEIARVLRPGGTARIEYHGVGYSLKYLWSDPNWKRRVYAVRTIVNTAIYRVTGARLPGFWGDTLFQTTRHLQQYYQKAGLELVTEHPSPRFAGTPVFIYHTLQKRHIASGDSVPSSQAIAEAGPRGPASTGTRA